MANSLIADLFKFTKNPSRFYQEEIQNKYKTNHKFQILIHLIAFNILLSFAAVRIQTLITNISGYNIGDNNVVAETLDQFPFITAFLVAVIAIPLIEEIVYRLWIKPSKPIFVIGFFIFIIFNLPLIPGIQNLSPFLLILLSFVAFISLMYTSIWVDKQKLEKILLENLRFIVYFTAITFGLIHIFNYENIGNFWWLTPILILPQLIGGFTLGYLRLKLGFVWGFFGHALYNCIFVIPLLGYLNASPELQNMLETEMMIENLSQSDQFYFWILTISNLLIFGLIAILNIQVFQEFFKSLKSEHINE